MAFCTQSFVSRQSNALNTKDIGIAGLQTKLHGEGEYMYRLVKPGLNMDEQFSAKQKNCLVRNNIIQKKAKDVNNALASERNEFERRMNVEAKKLLKRFSKTTETKQESEDRGSEHFERYPSPKLPVLPVIHHPGAEPRADDAPLPRSAPVSPTGFGRRTLRPLPHESAKMTNSLIPPEQPLPGIRRGSCSDLEKLGVPVPRRRSTFPRGAPEQLESLSVAPVSPKIPRNLALREKARKETSKDIELIQGEVGAKAPSLQEQFEALGSCRYLRERSNSDADV